MVGGRRGKEGELIRQNKEKGRQRVGSPPQHTWRICLVELLQKTQCLHRTRPQVDVNAK